MNLLLTHYIHCPCAHTNAFKFSFISSSVQSLWSKLPNGLLDTQTLSHIYPLFSYVHRVHTRTSSYICICCILPCANFMQKNSKIWLNAVHHASIMAQFGSLIIASYIKIMAQSCAPWLNAVHPRLIGTMLCIRHQLF